MAKLRVGYILDEGSQPNAVFDLVERSKASDLYSIELLIVQRTAKGAPRNALLKFIDYIKKRGAIKAIERISFTILARVERVLFARRPKFAAHFHRQGLGKFDIEQLIVEPKVSKSGFVYRYSDADIAEIRKHNLDVLLRGGSGILRGEILRVCKLGILSFHHADNAVNRGSPPGFWEVYNREPRTGFIIQQLSEELDGGDVLFRGAVTTAHSYVLNSVRLYLKANAFMHKLLERVARLNALPPAEPKQPYAYPLYTSPSITQLIGYALKTCGYMGAKLWRRLIGHTYRWGVAYQFVADWKDAVLWRSKRIKNPPHRFLADPFVVSKDGQHVILMEDYDIRADRGRIVAYAVDKSGATPLGPALEEPFHLSFPFVLEHEGALFMCPDTHEANEIRLYRCTAFPLKWELHEVLMKDVTATDTMIFKHNDKWWMLTNIDTSGLGDHSSELHVFCADALLGATWRPHPRNPVIFDPLCARNGGLLIEGDAIYRVFQVQGFDRYGESMGIAKITALDGENFAEERICAMPARFYSGLQGAHTYAFADGLLALDYVTFESASR